MREFRDELTVALENATMHIPQGDETVAMYTISEHTSHAAAVQRQRADGWRAVLIVLGLMLFLTVVVVIGWVIH